MGKWGLQLLREIKQQQVSIYPVIRPGQSGSSAPPSPRRIGIKGAEGLPWSEAHGSKVGDPLPGSGTYSTLSLSYRSR